MFGVIASGPHASEAISHGLCLNYIEVFLVSTQWRTALLHAKLAKRYTR